MSCQLLPPHLNSMLNAVFFRENMPETRRYRYTFSVRKSNDISAIKAVTVTMGANFKVGCWLVCLGLPALSDSISVCIGPSPREKEKKEKICRGSNSAK